MKNALLSLLLACFMASCQTNDSRIPVFEARQGQPISVSLKSRDTADLEVWKSCHTRNVWFDVKDSHGRTLPEYFVADIFWSKSAAEHSRHDATEFKVHVEIIGVPMFVKGVPTQFVIGKGPMLFGKWIKKPGTYLLEFHIDCYDRNHLLLYSSKPEKIRCHISERTFLDKRPETETSEVTLWVGRQRKEH